MRLQIDELGKVAITVEELYWDINKDYDKLTVVEKQGVFGTYISRKPVPAGTELTNRKYWIPFSSLKEEIVIDYNAFIDRYKEILDSYGLTLNNHEDRIKAIEGIRSAMTALMQKSEEVIKTSKNTIDKSLEVLGTANATLNKAELALKDSNAIKLEAQNAVNIANKAASEARATSDLAKNVLNQANKAIDIANTASKDAQEAIEISNKALCIADKYFKLAQELKEIVDATYEDIIKQDAAVKELYNNTCALHDHVRQELLKVNNTINNINSTVLDINDTVNRIYEISKGYGDSINELYDTKVDKVDGKGLSSNDFTDILKAKLDSLENYNDKELRDKIETLTTNFNTLLNANPTEAIESFNEIIAFLNNILDNETLEGIIGGIQLQIGNLDEKLKEFKDETTESLNVVKQQLIHTNASLNNHIDDKNNPHGVTAEQVGLGNVDNTSDLDKPISNATQEALDNLENNILIKSVNDTIFDVSDDGELDLIVGDGRIIPVTKPEITNTIGEISLHKYHYGLASYANIAIYDGSRNLNTNSKFPVSEKGLHKELTNLKASIKEELAPLFEDIYRIIGYEKGNYFVVVNNGDSFTYQLQYKSQTIETKTNAPTRVDVALGYTIYSFKNCSSLTFIDLSNFKTRSTSMYDLFKGCSSLTNIDLTNFDLSGKSDIQGMFDGCSSLISLDLSSFNTFEIGYFYNMFRDCSSLTSLDLSNFSTESAQGYEGMFRGCTSLVSLDLSNFTPPKLPLNDNMFSGCDSLTRIKCKREFKNWCETNKTTIGLSSQYSKINWEIVD